MLLLWFCLALPHRCAIKRNSTLEPVGELDGHTFLVDRAANGKIVLATALSAAGLSSKQHFSFFGFFES